MSVLLVEDNAQLTETLARGIAEHGFAVEVEHTGRGALERLLSGRPDLVILDLGLPDIDGIEVLASARRAGIAVPVLVLIVRNRIASRIAVLESGAAVNCWNRCSATPSIPEPT
jgi:DNA-binding response OmpR family regulator